MRQGAVKNLVIVLILLSVGLAFRTLNLGKEFSGDETIMVNISQQSLENGMSILKQRGVYPPLTYIAVHYMMKINPSEVWIRSYFVLFGMGVCFLIYLLGREYLGPRFAGVALLLSVFSPLLIFSSQYVRSYIDSAFWMVASTLFMLKILKGGEKTANWIGYTVSALLAIYTSYFSALLIFAQLVFVAIFRYKNIKFMLRWVLALSVIVLLFLPWLPSALDQYHNIPIRGFNWADKGFNLGPVRIGLFTRNIFSIIGFDPYFMIFHGGITKHFPRTILALGVLISLGLFMLFIFYCLKCLRAKLYEKSEPVWFFPILTFVPLVSFWLLSVFLNILPNARYLVAFHAFFLMLVAVCISTLLEKRRFIGNILLILVLAIFALRIPQAVSPEFDIKKAFLFLNENMEKNDGLICIGSVPPEEGTFTIIKADKYLKPVKQKSEYAFKSFRAEKELREKTAPFKKVWFYRVYGNAEIFGANRLIDDWLKEEGYKRIQTTRFKNIDIMEYERQK